VTLVKHLRGLARPVFGAAIALGAVVAVPAAALAAEHQVDLGDIGSQDLGAIGKELFALFVVVTLMESALSTLFQWRAYRMLFNGRAWKTPIMFVAGLGLVWVAHYDPFGRLLDAAKIVKLAGSKPQPLNSMISALILAGGSAGVNSLFRAFGIRNNLTQEAPARPDNDKAWVSVLVRSKTFAGPFQVLVERADGVTTAPPVAGTVRRESALAKEAILFFASPLRFPNYGGWEVDAEKPYRISIRYEASKRETRSNVIFEGAFAPRAMVDLVYSHEPCAALNTQKSLSAAGATAAGEPRAL